MAHTYVPVNHLVVSGTLLTLREAHELLGPGRYDVVGRLPGSPVQPLRLVVTDRGARLEEREDAR